MMTARRLSPLLLAVLLATTAPLACRSAEEGARPEPAAPLVEVGDAYALAGERALPEMPPEEFQGLYNVFHLSDAIISGSEPHGEEAFAELERMGVRTILSVDGKAPEAALAARHGIRYVHVPIRYSGIEEEELLQIAKTFREQDGPFYVHCFHGKHRGPAAAAVGRIIVDGADRKQAVAEMRQWCGTSKKYTGLYETLATTPIPGAEATAAYDFDFPAAKPMQGFRQGMVEVPRLHDDLLLLATNDWAPDPAHPDLDALNLAESLLDVLIRMNELEEVRERPADFRASMDESVLHGGALVSALQSYRDGEHSGGDAEAAVERAHAAFDGIRDQCSSCHRAYRNHR